MGCGFGGLGIGWVFVWIGFAKKYKGPYGLYNIKSQGPILYFYNFEGSKLPTIQRIPRFTFVTFPKDEGYKSVFSI